MLSIRYFINTSVTRSIIRSFSTTNTINKQRCSEDEHKKNKQWQKGSFCKKKPSSSKKKSKDSCSSTSEFKDDSKSMQQCSSTGKQSGQDFEYANRSRVSKKVRNGVMCTNTRNNTEVCTDSKPCAYEKPMDDCSHTNKQSEIQKATSDCDFDTKQCTTLKSMDDCNRPIKESETKAMDDCSCGNNKQHTCEKVKDDCNKHTQCFNEKAKSACKNEELPSYCSKQQANDCIKNLEEVQRALCKTACDSQNSTGCNSSANHSTPPPRNTCESQCCPPPSKGCGKLTVFCYLIGLSFLANLGYCVYKQIEDNNKQDVEDDKTDN